MNVPTNIDVAEGTGRTPHATSLNKRHCHHSYNSRWRPATETAFCVGECRRSHCTTPPHKRQRIRSSYVRESAYSPAAGDSPSAASGRAKFVAAMATTLHHANRTAAQSGSRRCDASHLLVWRLLPPSPTARLPPPPQSQWGDGLARVARSSSLQAGAHFGHVFDHRGAFLREPLARALLVAPILVGGGDAQPHAHVGLNVLRNRLPSADGTRCVSVRSASATEQRVGAEWPDRWRARTAGTAGTAPQRAAWRMAWWWCAARPPTWRALCVQPE